MVFLFKYVFCVIWIINFVNFLGNFNCLGNCILCDNVCCMCLGMVNSIGVFIILGVIVLIWMFNGVKFCVIGRVSLMIFVLLVV